MSEYGYAFIRIGGLIPESAVEDLCEAIKRDGAYLGYDGSGMFCPTSYRDLLDAVDLIEGGNGLLVLSDGEARNGVFEWIENFCVRANISFDRYSTVVGDYPAEWLHRRSEGVKDFYSISDDGQNYYTPQGVIYDLKKILEKGDWEGALHMLDTQTFLSITNRPLEPFKIAKNCGSIL